VRLVKAGLSAACRRDPHVDLGLSCARAQANRVPLLEDVHAVPAGGTVTVPGCPVKPPDERHER